MNAPLSRYPSVDALRALALWGIALMNFEYFRRMPATSLMGVDGSLVGLDYTWAWLTRLLVHGKFWSIFALLFGASLVWFARNHHPRDQWWRLGVLGCLGVLHGVLIWWGDILGAYALCGWVVWGLFKNSWKTLITVAVLSSVLYWWVHSSIGLWPLLWIVVFSIKPWLIRPSSWWKWGVGLTLIGPLFSILGVSLMDSQGALNMYELAASAATSQWAAAANPSWLAFVAFQFQTWSQSLLSATTCLSIIGVMMVGVWAAQVSVLTTTVPRSWWTWGVVGAVATMTSMMVAPTWTVDHGKLYLMMLSVFQIAQLPMALLYIAIAQRGFEKYSGCTNALAPAGQMTLTLYVAQSVVFTFIFSPRWMNWNSSFVGGWIAASVVVVVLYALAYALRRSGHRGGLEQVWKWAASRSAAR